MKQLVNESVKFKFTPSGGESVSGESVTTPSTPVKAMGDGVYSDTITITATVSAPPGYQPASQPGTWDIKGTGKVLASGKPVLLKGDKATAPFVGNWVMSSPPNSPLVTQTDCEVDDAGQDKVLSA